MRRSRSAWISAEESFSYSRPYVTIDNPDQTLDLYDGYPGELNFAQLPTIISSSTPAVNASNVARGTKVTLTFRNLVNQASAQARFRLTNGAGKIQAGAVGYLLKEEAPVKVSFDSKNVLFNLKNHTLVCRLIEGSYPNYNAVIPTANPNKVLIDRIELVNGIKRVAVCSNPATNLIRMDIADNKINLTAQDIDYSMSANETISCSYDGQSITIGFKSTFLVEILSNIETPTVVIELADSTRAGVFKPVYDEKQSSDTLMLLMPMMINA